MHQIRTAQAAWVATPNVRARTARNTTLCSPERQSLRRPRGKQDCCWGSSTLHCRRLASGVSFGTRERFRQCLLHRVYPLLANLVRGHRLGDDLQQIVDVGFLLLAKDLGMLLQDAIGLLKTLR